MPHRAAPRSRVLRLVGELDLNASGGVEFPEILAWYTHRMQVSSAAAPDAHANRAGRAMAGVHWRG
jgi:hypothetical protein